MKKLFTMVALVMLTLTAGAQEKKAWLFYEGLSDETVANLNADAANWASNGAEDDGTVYNWKNAAKQSADTYWMANGEVIEELRGLLIDIGSNKDNSVHLQTVRKGGDGKIRLTRKNTKITFPKLANGQKITIQGRSANGTATNRGIAPVQSYLQFQADESSPQTNDACIFLGNQVEGSEGTYTFVWKVVTEETDSVDVQFTLTPDAGIDFTYFMIDNGDAPDVQEAQPIGYIYDGDLDSDYAYIYLSGSEAFALTEINAAETTATADSLQNFQAIVVSPTIAADNAYLATIKQAIAYVPVLNLNPNLYEALGYGKAIASESNLLGIVKTDFAAFEGLDIQDSDGVGILPLLSDDANIVGVQLGDYFAKDDVVAYAGGPDGGIVAMHLHNAKRNAYLLLPLPLESMAAADQDIISTLIPQALQAIVDTKKDVVAVSTPVISMKQENGSTTVTITASNSNAIYYTTDGSDPTTASTLYTEPFTLFSLTTVKAFAIGDGYTDSKVAEKEIVIKTQAATPAISVEQRQGKSVISLSSNEGIDIYFNFHGVSTSADSQLYTEPIELSEPATIYVLAEGGDYLPSELGSQDITVNGFNGRTNEVLHFDANETDWFVDNSENGGEGKASAYYYWGKSAWNYYSEEVDHEDIVKDSEGNDSTVYVYKPNAEALKEVNPNNPNGWVLRSRGQVLTGELQLSFEKGVGNGRANRYAEEAIDYISLPSKGVITFGAKVSGEPYTASIETTDKVQGPFDVVVFCGNGNNGSAATMVIQTSADGENWNTVDTLKMAATQRYIKRTRASYNAASEVYLRVAHVGGATKSQIYDIYVLNAEGEEPGIAGDVNEDGTVDVADISAIISHMAGTALSEHADVNGDGNVDVADISNVISIMAGGK